MLLHRKILNAPPDLQVDHINRNILDNRKINLRLCTGTQNQGNRIRRKNSSSIYKGVHFAQDRQKWRAGITKNGVCFKLGTFNAEVEAAIVYDDAAKLYFGEFALLNFMGGRRRGCP